MQTASSWPCPHTPRQISSRPSIRVSRRHTRRSRTPRPRSSPLRTARTTSRMLWTATATSSPASKARMCSRAPGRRASGKAALRTVRCSFVSTRAASAGGMSPRIRTKNSFPWPEKRCAFLGIETEPRFARVHRWPLGMPQYVLGHPQRLERIDAALGDHPGLALAGAAYRGVGIPDCIHSGEEAARSLALSLAGVRG